MRPATLHRVVRLTARASGVFFAAAHTASALNRSAQSRSAGQAARPLYLAFLLAHAIHFAAVARYAVATGGRRLFPGGRDLHDVGGWPTVLAVYSTFAALALTGTSALSVDSDQPPRGLVGPGAAGLVAALFVATYLRQVPESRWFAAPAVAIGAATGANLATSRRCNPSTHACVTPHRRQGRLS